MLRVFSHGRNCIPGNSWRSKFRSHREFHWHSLMPAEDSQKMNDENTHPCGYGEGQRRCLATCTQTLWPRSTSISFSKWAFPQGAQHSPHLLICHWSSYRTPPSPVKDEFQQEHVSDAWPGCSPADNHPLLSDLKTGLEGMLVRLLNQLKLMFRYT